MGGSHYWFTTNYNKNSEYNQPLRQTNIKISRDIDSLRMLNYVSRRGDINTKINKEKKKN